jgi:hypothetical protein
MSSRAPRLHVIPSPSPTCHPEPLAYMSSRAKRGICSLRRQDYFCVTGIYVEEYCGFSPIQPIHADEFF